MNANGKHYEHFEPPERLTLLLEAMARRDDAEVSRLTVSTPRKSYTQLDAAVGDRLDLAFDTMAVVCIDLRGLWGKLHILHWATGVARQMATHLQITATLAFLEGTRCGEGQPQMEFFGKPRSADEPDEDDGHGDDDDDDVELPGEPADHDDHRLSKAFDGEAGRRMAAVEGRARQATDDVFLPLFVAAHDLAVELASTWEALGRFSRTRLGVAPETMLNAWGFPVAGDFDRMLKMYAHVKPDPAKADEYFGLICSNWDKRFGDDE